MSDKVAEIQAFMSGDDTAAWVTYMWITYNNQRREKITEWNELRNYIFATDTRSTSNSTLPWKNSTTLPKICQIRDNLHANYISALFPNDSWLKWEGYTHNDALKVKAKTIESYMSNKTRIGGFRTEVSKMVLDYIDYGNAFAMPSFEERYKVMADGTKVPDFIGPKSHRLSPLDIVFNPLASTFKDTFKIVRSMKSLGELKKLSVDSPDHAFWEAAIANRLELRNKVGAYSVEDFDKATGFSVDGFGNYHEYLQSDYIEILEFYGNYHDKNTGEIQTDRVITVVDRSMVVRNEQMPEWYSGSPIDHVGWRIRQDNLWAMGPLDNLVGLQYRLDHLENLKADAMDLLIHPPLIIKGEVEEFTWGPGVEIFVDEGESDIRELGKNASNVFNANSEMQLIEDRMELYAGAPREAMGVRTPGEKTLGEVEQLASASGRIFQEKITHFEVELVEKQLNKMLEASQRNMKVEDVIRIMDNDIGAEIFSSITVNDITANGVLRPVGARHFAKQAKDLRNLSDVFNSPLGQMIAPHTSAIEVTKFIDDTLGLQGYKMFSPNIAVKEQEATQVETGISEENVAAQLAPENAPDEAVEE
jgi:hypothetical protein